MSLSGFVRIMRHLCLLPSCGDPLVTRWTVCTELALSPCPAEPVSRYVFLCGEGGGDGIERGLA